MNADIYLYGPNDSVIQVRMESRGELRINKKTIPEHDEEVREKAVENFADWIIEKKSCCGYIEDVPVGVFQQWVLEWEDEVHQ